jgi:hypothetical protein
MRRLLSRSIYDFPLRRLLTGDAVSTLHGHMHHRRCAARGVDLSQLAVSDFDALKDQ